MASPPPPSKDLAAAAAADAAALTALTTAHWTPVQADTRTHEATLRTILSISRRRDDDDSDRVLAGGAAGAAAVVAAAPRRLGRRDILAAPAAVPALVSLLKDSAAHLSTAAEIAARALRNVCAGCADGQAAAAAAGAHTAVALALAQRTAVVAAGGRPTAMLSGLMPDVDWDDEGAGGGVFRRAFYGYAAQLLCNMATGNAAVAGRVWDVLSPVAAPVVAGDNPAAAAAVVACVHNCVAVGAPANGGAPPAPAAGGAAEPVGQAIGRALVAGTGDLWATVVERLGKSPAAGQADDADADDPADDPWETVREWSALLVERLADAGLLGAGLAALGASVVGDGTADGGGADRSPLGGALTIGHLHVLAAVSDALEQRSLARPGKGTIPAATAPPTAALFPALLAHVAALRASSGAPAAGSLPFSSESIHMVVTLAGSAAGSVLLLSPPPPEAVVVATAAATSELLIGLAAIEPPTPDMVAERVVLLRALAFAARTAGAARAAAAAAGDGSIVRAVLCATSYRHENVAYAREWGVMALRWLAEPGGGEAHVETRKEMVGGGHGGSVGDMVRDGHAVVVDPETGRPSIGGQGAGAATR